MRLVSMVTFVLQMGETSECELSNEACIDMLLSYANLLNKPLSLEMFIPSESKKKVLFEGFEIVHEDKVRVTIQYEFQQLDYNKTRGMFESYNKVEDLTGCHLDLILSDSASKKFKIQKR